jgi:PTH2 family peptidyl-tRNA hydrolase
MERSMSEEPSKIKQVIVMRHDLKMRRGKQIAQGAHASMAFLCRRLQQGPVSLQDFSEVQRTWLTERFAKVCCRANSEEELLHIYDQAVVAGLEVHLIVDSGKTEFHGQPTRTCLAIGPDLAEKIDVLTRHLELL